MHIKKHLLLLLATIFIIVNNECRADKIQGTDIVAKYNTFNSITIEELNQYINDWLYYKKYKSRADIYNHALNDMLISQLKRLDFFEKKLDKDNKLIQNITRIINEELVAEYFETKYVAKYANEELAKKIYGIMDKEVVYQLIELNKPENASPKQLDSLMQRALEIKSEISSGRDFSSLVKVYSQNKTSLMNNGFMPPVNWKLSLSSPVHNIIFQMNKGDLRVLNTKNTINIVKIADINKVHVEPFDSIKSKIISELKEGYSDIITQEYEKDKKALIDENNLQWNETAIKEIVRWTKTLDFYKGEYKKTFENALAKEDNKTILTYSRGIDSTTKSTLDYREYLRLLDNVLIMENRDTTNEDGIKKFILEALRTDLIVKKADSLDLKKNIFNAFTTSPALKSQILRLYNQAEIESKIPEASDDALRRFFKQNESTLYYQLEKRNIFIMVFDNKDGAGKAWEKIKEGTPFEKITGSYLVKTYIKDKDGEIKSYLNDEKPIFAENAFQMKESEVTKPINFEDENNQTKYAIIKCYNIRPEKQLTFNDVINSITEDFKSYYRKKIETDVEERLRSKYKPVINEQVLAKLISSN